MKKKKKIDKSDPEPVPEETLEEEEPPKVTNFNRPIKDIERNFKTIIKVLDRLMIRTCDENIFGDFLLTVVDEFRQEPKLKTRKNEIEITDHDRLLFLRQVDNGHICWKFYKMSKRRGYNLDLNVVLSGLLTPNERDKLDLKTAKFKEKLPEMNEQKMSILNTTTGRGLLLILSSILKFSFYTDLKVHYNHVMGIEDDSKFSIHYLRMKAGEADEDFKSEDSSDEEKEIEED